MSWIICSMGFAGYFLIVRDFVQAAQKMGSGLVRFRRLEVWSLCNRHYQWIYQIDLIFERSILSVFHAWLISILQIAIVKVIDYAIQKYGRDAVCQIINFGRMKAKMVVKDAARVMGISVEMQTIVLMVTEKTGKLAANNELLLL